ncbi:MAG: tRNA (adenosine(37)-N6)-threonylcarbamoyltransferase complex dimerization subunit type 1 TsaB [Chloroflexota bacterium]
MSRSGPILVIDTSTHTSVVAVGLESPLSVSRREVRHRHGSHVLEQIDEVLTAAGLTLDDLIGLAVGTGPGSFTGLRVGLATAKTLAYGRSLPLVGIDSAVALRLAGDLEGAAVVSPAGARDHYLSRPDQEPQLIAPGQLAGAIGSEPVIAVDMPPEALGEEAARRGSAAVAAMPAALLRLARERLAAGDSDDVAELVPVYVALPRGVKRAAEDLGWSPDLR